MTSSHLILQLFQTCFFTDIIGTYFCSLLKLVSLAMSFVLTFAASLVSSSSKAWPAFAFNSIFGGNLANFVLAAGVLASGKQKQNFIHFQNR